MISPAAFVFSRIHHYHLEPYVNVALADGENIEILVFHAEDQNEPHGLISEGLERLISQQLEDFYENRDLILGAKVLPGSLIEVLAGVDQMRRSTYMLVWQLPGLTEHEPELTAPEDRDRLAVHAAVTFGMPPASRLRLAAAAVHARLRGAADARCAILRHGHRRTWRAAIHRRPSLHGGGHPDCFVRRGTAYAQRSQRPWRRRMPAPQRSTPRHGNRGHHCTGRKS